MTLFSLGILLLQFDLGITKKHLGYWLGAGATALFLCCLAGDLIGEGYADIPVAFFAFLSVFCLLIAQEMPDPNAVRKYFILGGLFVAGAAVTKQAGLFMIPVYPLLAYFLVFRRHPAFGIKGKLILVLWYVGILLVVVMPFYLYKQIAISRGLEASEIDYCTREIYAGASLLRRANSAFFTVLYALWGKNYEIGMVLMVLALIVSFFDKTFRWILLLILLPFSIIWGLYFGYNVRNYVLSFPFWGLAVGMAGIQLFKLKNYVVFFLILSFLFLLSFRYDTSYLLNSQISQARNLFNAELDRALYDYFDHHPFKGRIFSSYPIHFLPELQVYGVLNHCVDPEVLRSAMSQQYVAYLLISETAPKPIWDELNGAIQKNKLQVVFKKQGFVFLKINGRE